MSFQNKTVWITGASSGIGEAIAYELSNRGAELIISSRRKDALEEVKRKCNNPSNVHIITLDLAQTDQLANKADEAL
ncbi:MAG: SDR family NAD(P)-dependent oxidoreductase, partial [Aliifodinibius sp.]|nr:SDR family NAD(P)-dependent oxidoreductase [candidate division Zixibacteria bacterium]NIT60411.1 SDR family NAD(P)-dependent oxidoreductase [Fodinibius sp.]NIS48159.1 SDR family NAD(P)-dependent oxidoreductase [candidate division Zixibacteria bacterium]NIU16275.1 SDR family NAD(P)-dependent oxidoreductase [candidate division Zixibacteria bacterium]NIV15150.1 SDR family NAD(P)-dependent oxidoreductase [Fodinibius sp.]